ncbi:MAG: LysR family transcriptional regulator [Oceanospirillaceae bacterium]
MKKQINLADIRTFVVLAEQGSFTKAAEKLMCSRSHISKQLAQLEARLGVSLLIRTTRTQHLTPQGEVFFERCERSLKGINHAVESVLEDADVLSGSIKINCVGGQLGEEVIAKLVNDFMLEYPDIDIELDFSSRRVDLIAGEFDFVFRMGALPDSSLMARKLTDIKIGIYASPTYLAKHGELKEPKDLLQHKCIAGSMRHWHFLQNKSDKKYDLLVNANLTCKNGRVMIMSASLGNGIIRVPEFYCRQAIKEGKLVALFDDWAIESTPLYLVYVQDKHCAMRLRVFKEFVMANFCEYM